MKSLLVFIVSTLFFVANSASQNVGVNTPTPEATLDVNGDIIFRTAAVTVADGITIALDVNNPRFSYYRLTGPTADFTIAGITAGNDGRLLTLFNRTGFTMQINNEDVNAAVTDMIITGTNADITIINKGIVNLQYDATEQKWIVKSSSKGAIAGGGGFWDANGTHIFNTNSGNVGIGTTTPAAKLDVVGNVNINGANTIEFGAGVAGKEVNAGKIGYQAFGPNIALDIVGAGTTGTNRIIKFWNEGGAEFIGSVGVGTSNPTHKLTVETPNNNFGITHRSIEGNILSTRIGGNSAGIGTFSTTNMRIFSNSLSRIMILASNGNVGIGTDNPTYKLSVLGNIRCTEAVVETGWADYVFEKNYQLPLLSDVEKFILKNKHLPNIPSAEEIKKTGLYLGDTQKRMMEKIEELTLYAIQQQKEIDALKEKFSHLNKVIK